MPAGNCYRVAKACQCKQIHQALFRRQQLFCKQKGFTLLAVIAAMLIAGLAAQGVVFSVTQQAMREREEQLWHVGAAYRQAIKDYYEASPGAVKSWPPNLEVLTYDNRFVGTKRHLREVYLDPITRTLDWGLVLAGDGGIRGVYSTSRDLAIQPASLEMDGVTFPEIVQYSDRRFEYVPNELNASIVSTPKQ